MVMQQNSNVMMREYNFAFMVYELLGVWCVGSTLFNVQSNGIATMMEAIKTR